MCLKICFLIHYYSEISVSLYLYVRPDMELGAFCKTDNMIETITVKNFKSITDMTLSLVMSMFLSVLTVPVNQIFLKL